MIINICGVVNFKWPEEKVLSAVELIGMGKIDFQNQVHKNISLI